MIHADRQTGGQTLRDYGSVHARTVPSSVNVYGYEDCCDNIIYFLF
jgi:hypothetical protein